MATSKKPPPRPPAKAQAKPHHYIYKSSITGKIVTHQYATAHPDTTFRERIRD